MGEQSTDRAGVANSAVGWFEFPGVMGVSTDIWFGCESCKKFGLAQIVGECRYIGVDGV